MKFAAVLDFETTGFDPEQGQIIEGAVALVEIAEDRRFGATVDRYASFNDPGIAIPAEITRLTGITDDDVRGQRLDWERFNGLLSRAAVLISHNVPFDRPWLERHGGYRVPHWACSIRNIRWNELHGMPCRSLKHLAWEHNLFPNSHRAMDDVDSVLHLLRQPSRGLPARTYGQELLESSDVRMHLVFATGAPFESKDLLKAQQFRWSPEKRVWWKVVAEDALPDLQKFLDESVYPGFAPGRPRYSVSDPVDPLETGFKTRHGLG